MEPLCSLNMNAVSLAKTPTRPQNPIVFSKEEPGDKSNSNSAEGEYLCFLKIIRTSVIMLHFEGNKKDGLVDRLVTKLPEINQYFIVHKKIGEGTFSNVFVATSKVFMTKKFAIKHLTPTSHPSRIIQELKCLKDIGYGVSVLFAFHEGIILI